MPQDHRDPEEMNSVYGDGGGQMTRAESTQNLSKIKSYHTHKVTNYIIIVKYLTNKTERVII